MYTKGTIGNIRMNESVIAILEENSKILLEVYL